MKELPKLFSYLSVKTQQTYTLINDINIISQSNYILYTAPIVSPTDPRLIVEQTSTVWFINTLDTFDKLNSSTVVHSLRKNAKAKTLVDCVTVTFEPVFICCKLLANGFRIGVLLTKC